jgi:hypothetical protein
MARKSFVLFTGAVGVAAVVAGALVSRRRRGQVSAAGQSRPVAGASDNARRYASEWRRDDTLADDLVEEPVATH